MKSAAAQTPGGQTATRRSRRQAPAAEERASPKRQPPYAVVLHNDDLNGFDFVISVLCKILRYDRAKSYRLTLEAHESGQSVVWSGALEVAELKADQIRACGPDPRVRAAGALPLRVSVQPLP